MLLYFLYSLIKFFVLILPIRVSYTIAVFFAEAYLLFGVGLRRIVRNNLKAIGITDNKELSRTTRGVYHSFAKYMIEFFSFTRLNRSNIHRKVIAIGRENLDKALARGKGGIIASAHIGNWEMGAAAISLWGYKMSVIAMVHKHPMVNQLFTNQRKAVGVDVFGVGSDVRHTLDAFNNNELVAIVGDRDFAQNGLVVDFFGQPARLPRGSALLHIKKDIAIIPTYTLRQEDDTIKVIFEPEIKIEFSGDKKTDQEKLVQAWAKSFEGVIKKYPDQWAAFMPVWEKEA